MGDPEDRNMVDNPEPDADVNVDVDVNNEPENGGSGEAPGDEGAAEESGSESAESGL